ncbi:voltage-gated potassium channel subunit beta-2 [Alternaria alternata]|nr:voltage-gated potassium channel subunit beta-2 [Alternaria alternata]
MSESEAPKDLPEMEYRFMGKSGLQISAISLGGWLTYGGHVGDDNTFACLKAAFDAGINFFDCAEGYAKGESEKVMGRAIKHFNWNRNDIVVSTKVSPCTRCTSEWLASEIEEAWAVADRLGLIGPIVEQPGYSLLRRDKVDQEFKDANLYGRRGLGLTIFSPLQGGLLTGKYVDGVPDDSRLRQSDDPYIQSVIKTVGSDAWNQQQDKIKKLMDIAKKLDTDVATLSMAWVLSNKNVSSAITGASRPEQIYQTVKAVDVYRKLTKENLNEIEQVMGSKPAELTMRFG